ncbi:hypothetical protein CC80DRAFT_48001 [Byssothecium circinans]|uniref:Uncharacterized protein n=1 Tax=Byssothecium circinans TaxID=147558 RepID=A0A6A5U0Y2_9PLEO|nr:hypothetical protein CC80DRAFT_48001 [Byssothecium circinans]
MPLLAKIALKRSVAKSTDIESLQEVPYRTSSLRSSSKTSKLSSLLRRGQQQTILQEEADEIAQSSAPVSPASPEASQIAISFVNTLNSAQLSDFIAWFLYFDVAELPQSPTAWYNHIDAMAMRGWISLGIYLSETVMTGHGFNLVVLDSICDRLSLPRAVVHEYFIQLSEPQNMAWSQLALTISQGQSAGKTEAEMVEVEEKKVKEMLRMAQRIRPTKGSKFEQWRDDIVGHLKGYLEHVIVPRYSQPQRKTAARSPMSHQQSIDRLKGLKLAYLYEAMQQEREVPLIRYGIFPEASSLPRSLEGRDRHDGRSVPSIHESFIEKECEIERSHSATTLQAENRRLRILNAELNKDNEALRDSNFKMARKIATLGRVQPFLYQRPNWHTDTRDSSGSIFRSQSVEELPDTPTTRRLRLRAMSDSGTKKDVLSVNEKLMVAAGNAAKAKRRAKAAGENSSRTGALNRNAALEALGVSTQFPTTTVAALFPNPESSDTLVIDAELSRDHDSILDGMSKPLPSTTTPSPLLSPTRTNSMLQYRGLSTRLGTHPRPVRADTQPTSSATSFGMVRSSTNASDSRRAPLADITARFGNLRSNRRLSPSPADTLSQPGDAKNVVHNPSNKKSVYVRCDEDTIDTVDKVAKDDGENSPMNEADARRKRRASFGMLEAMIAKGDKEGDEPGPDLSINF